MRVYGIVCKKCNKIMSYGNYDTKKDVFINCCRKKKVIDTNDVINIQRFNYKCAKCNKLINCYYIERTCPNCGEKNIEKHCYNPPTGKPKPMNLNKRRY